MTGIDKVDRQILNIIQQDGRITVKAIAARLDMSTTPIFERIKRLEREGIIERYAALINQKKIDRKLIVFVSVSLKNHTRSYLEKFTGEINSFTEVLECYHIAGDFDFILKVVLKDMEAYENFILTKLSVISNIAHVKSSFVLSKTKHTTAFAL